MGIGRIEAARGRALTRIKPADRAGSGADARPGDARTAARARGPRHVLHGWRLLAGPVIVQVLQNGYEPPHHPATLTLKYYLAQRQTHPPIIDEIA